MERSMRFIGVKDITTEAEISSIDRIRILLSTCLLLCLMLAVFATRTFAVEGFQDFQDAVNANEVNLAWAEFVKRRAECKKEPFPDLCYERAWLDLQMKLTGLPGVKGVPPWLQPTLDVVKQEEKKIQKICGPLEKKFKPLRQQMIHAEKECDFGKAMALRNKIVIGLFVCPHTYTYKFAVNDAKIIQIRRSNLAQAKKEYEKLKQDARKAEAECEHWKGDLSTQASGIIEDCRPEWRVDLYSHIERVEDTVRRFKLLEKEANTTLARAETSIHECTGMSAALSGLEGVQRQELFQRCGEELIFEVEHAWHELSELQQKYKAFEKDAYTVIKRAEMALEQCTGLEPALSNIKKLMNSPMYARCATSEIAMRAKAGEDEIGELIADLKSRQQRIQLILRDANWAIHKCDWKALEANQSRALKALPSGNCLVNNPRFLDLRDQIYHGLLSKKKRWLDEIKPLHDKILAHVQAAEAYLRKREVHGPYKPETWNKNVAKHYNNERRTLDLYIKEAQHQGYSPCIRDLVARVEKLPKQIQATLIVRKSESITGTWETNYGDLTLKGTGAKYTGAYDDTLQDGRVLKGLAKVKGAVLEGNELKGYWTNQWSQVKCDNMKYRSEYWGKFKFTFNNEFNRFSGTWSYCDGQRGGTWKGKRK